MFWLLSMIEPATGGVLEQKVFLEMSQNSQESTCAREKLSVVGNLHWFRLRIIEVFEWNPEEHQPQHEPNLKNVRWEQLFGVYHLRKNVWVHKIFHIFPNTLVYKSNHNAKLYQKLLMSQGKLLLHLAMNIRQKLYRCCVLWTVTDANKIQPGGKRD